MCSLCKFAFCLSVSSLLVRARGIVVVLGGVQSLVPSISQAIYIAFVEASILRRLFACVVLRNEKWSTDAWLVVVFHPIPCFSFVNASLAVFLPCVSVS